MSYTASPFVAASAADTVTGPANYDSTQIARKLDFMGALRLRRAVEKNGGDGAAVVTQLEGDFAALQTAIDDEQVLVDAAAEELGFVNAATITGVTQVATAPYTYDVQGTKDAAVIVAQGDFDNAVIAYDVEVAAQAAYVQPAIGVTDATANNVAWYGASGQPDVGTRAAPLQPATILV